MSIPTQNRIRQLNPDMQPERSDDSSAEIARNSRLGRTFRVLATAPARLRIMGLGVARPVEPRTKKLAINSARPSPESNLWRLLP